MKVYRLFKGWTGDGHMGFEFYETKRAAEVALKTMCEAGAGEVGSDPAIEAFDSGKGRHGLVHLLNKIADHPDNG